MRDASLMSLHIKLHCKYKNLLNKWKRLVFSLSPLCYISNNINYVLCYLVTSVLDFLKELLSRASLDWESGLSSISRTNRFFLGWHICRRGCHSSTTKETLSLLTLLTFIAHITDAYQVFHSKSPSISFLSYIRVSTINIYHNNNNHHKIIIK